MYLDNAARAEIMQLILLDKNFQDFYKFEIVLNIIIIYLKHKDYIPNP